MKLEKKCIWKGGRGQYVLEESMAKKEPISKKLLFTRSTTKKNLDLQLVLHTDNEKQKLSFL